MWEVGYVLDGEFVPRAEAIRSVYEESYRRYFREHPEDLAVLARTARELRNPHAAATGGVDLQVPAVLRVLAELEVELAGEEVVDIGTWQGRRSHPLSERLSPLHVRCAVAPKLTLERFWQAKKCLAVWKPD